MSKEDEKHIELEIQKLLAMGAIEKCRPLENQFLSSYFLVPKPNGSNRFILNLKLLNQFIKTSHFKMKDLRSALRLFSQDYYLCNLDIKDAYFLVPVNIRSRQFLRFKFKGQLYEFTCLPFGLCTAPFVFTKIMKPVLHYLRERGQMSTAYLDDLLCIGNSYSTCQENVTITRNILNRLGFIVNEEKSLQTPQQVCKYLGFILNSSDMTLSLPLEKRVKIKKAILEIMSKKICQIREMAGLIGVLVAACPAVPYGMLHTKRLEKEKMKALIINDQDLDQKMFVSDCLNDDLNWWLNKVPRVKNPVRLFNFQKEIFSDASLSGWGAYYNKISAQGFWSVQERKLAINNLELIAAFLALKCFAKEDKDCEILLRIDNTTAIAYINRMGGVQYPQLNKLARDIWNWCKERRIWVFASYIPSKENTDADRESRRSNVDTECELGFSFFDKIVEKWGWPDIDLFASRNNAKVSTFCAWKRDPDALFIDAFTLNWKKNFFYGFHPSRS